MPCGRCTLMGVKREHRLNLDDLAARTGLTKKTLTGYLPKGLLVAPDDHVIEKGHARPVWDESTIVAWESTRRGRGWRKGQTAS